MLTFYLLAVKYDGRGHKGSVLPSGNVDVHISDFETHRICGPLLSLHNNRIISGSNGVQVNATCSKTKSSKNNFVTALSISCGP